MATQQTVRNILDQMILNQNLRTEDEDDNRTIILDDVEDYILETGIDLHEPTGTGTRKIGFQ